MKRVSQKIIARALLYIRTLEALIKERKYLISSKQLAEITGLTDVQIRKDISNFGKVGKPRVGYKTIDLKKVLEKFVLQKTAVNVVLFGVGNLGSAIMRYPGFHSDKIKLVAAFEKDKKKIGRVINDIKIYAINDVKRIIKNTNSEIGIIAVPKEYSQEIADVIVASGIRGIINFAPISVNVPSKVFVKDIDLSIEFLSLVCDIRK